MQTSGVFTTHNYEIPVQYNKPFSIILFGDVHRDSPNHAQGAWQKDLAGFKKMKNTWFLGMGDYLDATSSSERAVLNKSKDEMHETTRYDLETIGYSKTGKFAQEIGFMKGRLIGLINGNHYYQFQNGTNSDQKLCEHLGCKYLGVSGFIRLTLTCAGRNHTMDIWAHHGKGASRLVGGSINRVEQMREYAEADVFVMGHDHKKAAVPATPRLYLQNSNRNGLTVKQRQSWLVRSGSYLASYEDGVSNYNVDACRGPSSLGHVQLIVTAQRDGSSKRHNNVELKIQALV